MPVFLIQLLRGVLLELETLIEPLLEVGRSQLRLYRFLATLGWDLEKVLAADTAALAQELMAIQGDLALTVLALQQPDQAEMVAEAHARFRMAIDRLDRLYPLIQGIDLTAQPDPGISEIAQALAGDVLQQLFLLYLVRRLPSTYRLGRLFGLIVQRRAEPIHRQADPTQPLLRYPIQRIEFNWDGLTSPSANPLMALVESVDLMGVRSIEGFFAAVGAALEDQLAELWAILGSRGLDGMTINLNHSGLSLLGGNWLPFPAASDGTIDLSVPESWSPRLVIEPERWWFTWSSSDAAEGTEVTLFEAGGIEIYLDAATPEPSGVVPILPGINLYEAAGVPTLEIVGGLGFRLAGDLVSGMDGLRLAGSARGRLTVPVGAGPSLMVERLLLSGAFRLGAGGLALREAQVEIAEFAWPLADPGRFPFDLRVQGLLDLPNDSQIALVATYDGENLGLASTGQVYLGGGIWLFPDGDQPILSLQSEIGESVTFQVSALFKAPHAGQADGTKAVQVSGSLTLRWDDGGWWQVEHFQAGLAASGLDWTLPGDIRLTDARVNLAYDHNTGSFQAEIAGVLQLGSGLAEVSAGLQFDDVTDPTWVHIDGGLALGHINLFDQATLIDVDARLLVETRFDAGSLSASGAIVLNQATAGLFPQAGWDPVNPAPEQFQLSVVGLQGQFTFGPQGFELLASAGTLQLPAAFGPDPDTPGAPLPSVSLSPAQPLRFSVTATQASFSGTFLFSDFGIRFQDVAGAGDFVARLDSATLHLSSAELPRLAQAAGSLRLPLPDGQQAIIAFADVQWQLDGLPEGAIYLAESLPPIDLGGVEFIVLGGGESSHPVTGLTVSRQGAVTRFQISSQLRVVIAADLITDVDGDAVFLEAGGQLSLTTDNLIPLIEVTHLAAGGTFHLGGAHGLVIEEAQVAAENIGNLFEPTPAAPFVLALSGRVTLPNGPTGGLENARFIFEGDPWPRFDLDGISGGTGDMDLVEGGYLPVAITDMRLTFDHAQPMPQKLLPQHVTVLVDALVNVQSVLTGSVNDLEIKLDDQGIPQVNIDGFHLDVSGLELVEGFSLGGGIAIGGLSDIPASLVLAGQLGGQLNGTGVEALVAFGIQDGLPAPLGASLEASLGPAGIPLWASGFLLTGAAGGISFTGGNADPDDLRAYVQVAEDGTVTSRPRPDPQDAPIVEADQQSPTGPAIAPEDGSQLDFDCPDEPCPPPSVGIFYQPHPDSVLYPHRIIFKFSSLDQATVDQVLEEVGLPRAVLETVATPDAAAQAVAQIAGGIQVLLANSLPFTNEQLDQLAAPLEELLAQAIERALAGGESLYDALVAAAYQGVRAPNVTLKLTGTVSYTGISSFLSVTGGVVLSPTVQSAGIVGSLNLLGIPMGTLRGFLTLNDEAGLPDPALCGDLSLALGPLDLGNLRLSSRFGFDLVQFSADLLDLLGTLSLPLAAQVLQVVDGPLFASHGRDVFLTLQAMSPQQHLAFVALLMQQPDLDQVRPLLVALCDRLWSNFNPEFLLCGSVQPKLFGLALDGELVGVSANVSKNSFAAGFRFSPSGLLSRVLYGILPAFDQMKLSLGFQLPDPLSLIEASLGAGFNDPAVVAQVATEGLAFMLGEAVATIEYSIAPFGLELAEAQARLLLPHLLDHPAVPGSSWQRPEDRPGAYPSRLQVAMAALEERKLGDINWRGRAADLQALPGLADLGSTGDLDLREDYFPHGGILGAGRLMVPELLLLPPPVDTITDLLRGTLAEKLQAAQALLGLLTTPHNVGQLAFYVPAPNPPEALFPGVPDPLDLLAGVGDLSFDLEDLRPGPFYAFEESFLRGNIGSSSEPFTLLGVPVGFADVELQPPDGGAEGILRIRSGVPAGSWLQALVNSVTLDFTVRQTPAGPVVDHFRALQEAFARPGASQGRLVAQLAADLQAAVPRLALVAQLDGLKIPPGLDLLLGASGSLSAELHAYSPLYAYNPRFRGRDPVGRARNFGGVALRCQGDLQLGQQYGLGITLTDATFALIGGSSSVFPDLEGTFLVRSISLPFGLPQVRNAQVNFHSRSNGLVPLIAAGGLQVEGQVGSDRVELNLQQAGSRLTVKGSLAVSHSLDLVIGPLNAPGTRRKVLDRLLLKATLTGTMVLDLAPGDLRAQFENGSFQWQGQGWQVPAMSLAGTLSTATDWRMAIDAHIKSSARTIFQFLLSSPQAWADALQAGAIELTDRGVRAVAGILKSLGADLDEAGRLLADLFNQTVQDVIEGLYFVFTRDIAAVLSALGQAGFNQSRPIALAVRTLFKGQFAVEVARYFFDRWGSSWSNPALTIANRLAYAGFSIGSAATAIAELEFGVQTVIDALVREFGAAVDVALNTLRPAGFTNSVPIVEAMFALYGQQHAATLAKFLFDNWTQWSNPVSSIAWRFADAGYTIGTTAKALAGLSGVTLKEIISALYNRFDKDIAAVLGSLRGAGFHSSQPMADALHALYGDDFASELAAYFYNRWGTNWSNPSNIIANRLAVATFSLGATTQALFDLGAFTIGEVTQALINQFNATLLAIANALLAAGYSAGAILAELVPRGFMPPVGWG